MATIRAPVFFKPGLSVGGRKDVEKMLRNRFSVDERFCIEVVLNEKKLRTIYANLDGVLWKATKERLLGEQVKVLCLLIDGRVGIDKLVAFVGGNVDPHKCEKASLRYRFCRGKKAEKLSDGLWFFWNGIHRPKTVTEAENHFHGLFESLVCV